MNTKKQIFSCIDIKVLTLAGAVNYSLHFTLYLFREAYLALTLRWSDLT